MPNYKIGRYKIWLHHSVIKWKNAISNKHDVSMIKVITLFLLMLFLVTTSVNCETSPKETKPSNERQNGDTHLINQNSKGIHITSNSSTLLDCKDWKNCKIGKMQSWNWDQDNFTLSHAKSLRSNIDFPGQHGFYLTNYSSLRKIRKTLDATKLQFTFPERKKSGRYKYILSGTFSNNLT